MKNKYKLHTNNENLFYLHIKNKLLEFNLAKKFTDSAIIFVENHLILEKRDKRISSPQNFGQLYSEYSCGFCL